MSRIVVGADGSPGAQRAIDWAVDEARRRASTLALVHAWQQPIYAGDPMAAAALASSDLQHEAEVAAGRVLDAAIAALPDDVSYERVLVQGSAADALIDAARKDGELLVVGTRGHGGVTSLLLGSVSQACVHHAPCPVVIVPRPESGKR
jgi:nucleotide-binding universal stress UspA family protein